MAASRWLACSSLLAIATPVIAQESLTVRTFTLHAMRAADAARLVGPYVLTPGGGVFEVTGTVQAITIRESPAVLARVDSILRLYDRPPASVILRFDLIAALDSATKRDPAIESIDAALRSLFRYAGYRLLSQGSSTTSEHGGFSITLGDGQQQLFLDGEIGGVEAGEGGRRIDLRVVLKTNPIDIGGGRTPLSPTIFSTRLTVPLGQTVVLGSAMPRGGQQALILAVRPELAPDRR